MLWDCTCTPNLLIKSVNDDIWIPWQKFHTLHVLYILLLLQLGLLVLIQEIKLLIKKYFVGLASPASAAILICYVWLLNDISANMSSYLYLTLSLLLSLSILMVSNIAYFSFKDLNIRQKVPHLMLFGAALIVSFISFDPPKVLFIFFLLYGLSGPSMFLLRRLKRNSIYETNLATKVEDKEN